MNSFLSLVYFLLFEILAFDLGLFLILKVISQTICNLYWTLAYFFTIWNNWILILILFLIFQVINQTLYYSFLSLAYFLLFEIIAFNFRVIGLNFQELRNLTPSLKLALLTINT